MKIAQRWPFGSARTRATCRLARTTVRGLGTPAGTRPSRSLVGPTAAPAPCRGDRAADGLRGRPVRARYARNQAPQFDRRVPPYLGDRRRARPWQLSRGDGGCDGDRRHRSVARATASGASREELARPRDIDICRPHRPRHARLCSAAHGDHAGLRAGGADHGSLVLSKPGSAARRAVEG
jgi:hypothetical protein